MRALLVWIALFGLAVYAQAGPLDRVKPAVDKVVPELWSVNIHLKGGEVVKLEKVGFTEWGLRKRLTVNSAKKTLTVIPDGETQLRVIPTADIEKIEMVPVKDMPEVNPEPQVVPAPVSTEGCKCKGCNCKGCKC